MSRHISKRYLQVAESSRELELVKIIEDGKIKTFIYKSPIKKGRMMKSFRLTVLSKFRGETEKQKK
jgi:hypothetical protein